MWPVMWFSLIAHVTTYQWKGASEKYDFNDIDFDILNIVI